MSPAGNPLVESPTGFHVVSRPRPLDPIFKPRSVAVIGATEKAGAVGRTVLWNLISSPFGGTVYPINPNRPNVLGVKAYPSVKEVPERLDLAVICTPSPTVPALVQQCADAGVRGLIIISAGFKELGAPGIELERQVLEIARKAGIRIIGPNCLGAMNPLIGLNASFAAGIARPGNIAFLSQSGALGTAILDWSFQELVGFSGFVSLGSMLDVGFGDLIEYYGDDPQTKAILIYMESIGDARSFLSAAREVAMSKPIIIIKAGRTSAAAAAAASHTGSMTGSDDVLDAAFKRTGVLRVDSIDDLFSMAEVLSKQPRPKGPNLTVITNAGGPGVLATDALIIGGGELTALQADTMAELNKILPPQWSHNNPVDVLGDAPAKRYAQALEICAKDPKTDGLMVILTPQDMTDPTGTADELKAYAHKFEGKPVLASWMGGPFVRAGEEILNRAGIPTFPYPDTAARAFNYMWDYARNLDALYETPRTLNEKDDVIDRAAVKKIMDGCLAEGRTTLTEYESKKLIAAYGIPTVPTEIATTADEAVAYADKIGYPIVLKLYSLTITHKTDVGGVILNLANKEAVRTAFETIKKNVAEKKGLQHFQGVTVQPMMRLEGYEIILGSSLDAQFGPVILFGSGGQLVELYKDKALALPPLNTTLAKRLMEQTKIYKATQGIRGRQPVDQNLLEKIVVRFSQLLIEQPRIKEIDINPLLASAERIIALDARVILHEASVSDDQLPRPAIRPYPSQYVKCTKLKDGQALTLRPIGPEDEPAMRQFHATLSEQSVRQRYFIAMKLDDRVAHERLVRQCFNDFDREMVLAATLPGGEIVGVGRVSKIRGTQEAEIAVIVSDTWQGKGLGSALLVDLMDIAKVEKLKRVYAHMLPDASAKVMFEKQGFAFKAIEGANMIEASVDMK